MNNDSRLIQYTPLQIIDNNVIIHKKWFDLQDDSFQSELKENILPMASEFNQSQNKTYQLKIEDFEIPHNLISETDVYFAFIKLYKNRFKFDNFIHLFNHFEIVALCDTHSNFIKYERKEGYNNYGIIYECDECNNFYIEPECTLIKLDEDDLNCLIELHIKSNKKFHPSNLNLINENLINKISSVLEIYKDEGAFVKTSLKSDKKNSKGLKITPCFTVNDVFENLVSSDQILQSLLFGCNLIVRRWVDIKTQNEFRVYILNKQIKAICQQSLTEKIENKLDQNKLIEIIKKFYDSLEIEYDDCVLDLYISKEKIHLIEINSGGAWSTAGSGLFNWNEILNADRILFRYL
jgi:hypothetical protein